MAIDLVRQFFRSLSDRRTSRIRRRWRRFVASRGRFEFLEERTLLAMFVDTSAYRPQELLVRFRPGVEAGEWPLMNGTNVAHAMPLVSGLSSVRIVDPTLSVMDAVAAYRADPRVLYAEPNYEIRLQDVPNDADFDSLWGLNNTGQNGGTDDADIDGPEAWAVTTGSSSVTVAVLDTGVDYTHPDLAANIWTNSAEVPGDGIDNDANGFIDDVRGWDFFNNDADPMDDQGHGTHVAGTIGAVGNNGIGTTGINWHVQILPLKFLDSRGSGSVGDAILALDYAVQMGAQISNNSYGGDPFSQSFYDAINRARSAGHIFVAAAGNNGTNNDAAPFYPANYDLDNVVTVAATDRNDELAFFSNYGHDTVDLAAPGVEILSTQPNNTYATSSGTSMASPHVAGVMALVLGLHPQWSYRQVVEDVLNTVDPIPAALGRTITGGRLNAARAVGAPDNDGPRVIFSDPSGAIGGVVDSVTLTFQEPIDPASVGISDVTSFVGPSGPIPISSAEVKSGSFNRAVEIKFAPQVAQGTYTMQVGPEIVDLAGNGMDQNQSGTAGEIPGDQYVASFVLGDQYVFTSSDTPTSLSTFHLSTSTLTIDEDLSIADLNVNLDITYPDVGLLDIKLISPSGTEVQLNSLDFSLEAPNFAGTVFDDEAPGPINSGRSPFTGPFQPASLLSVLDGESTRGTWQLRVHSLWFYSGAIDSWGLTVVPHPPRLTISDLAFAEGDSGSQIVEFQLSLSNVVGATITVDFATRSGTATAGVDYESASGRLTFQPGEKNKTIPVVIYGDVQDEMDHTLYIDLSNPQGASLARTSAIGVIINDETSLSVSDVQLLEGNSGTSDAVFEVRLARASAQEITVTYATGDGSATGGSDYVSANANVVFAPGQTSRFIQVGAKGDAANEPDESFYLKIVSATNALVQDGRGQATLLNDDPLPTLIVNDPTITEGDSGTRNLTFVVSLSAASGRTVVVPYSTIDGSAIRGQDYQATSGVLSFLPGQTSKSINIVALGDGTLEPDETVNFELGAASGALLLKPRGVGTLLNDDATISITGTARIEGNGVANVSVSLSPAVSFPVSVDYATANGSAAAGQDYAGAKGTLVFAPGETTKTLPISVISDLHDEDNETFYVNLSNSKHALRSNSQATVTISDDDPLPLLSVKDSSIVEAQSGSRNLVFTISLSAVTGRKVTFDYATLDATATAGSDYEPRSGTASILAGSTSSTIWIPVSGDTQVEASESLYLDLSNVTNALLVNERATGVIVDDDNLWVEDASIVEENYGGQVVNISVRLGTALPHDVTFQFATANGSATAGSDYVATSGVAVISAGQTSALIPVQVLGDKSYELSETFYVNLTNIVGAVAADSQGTATLVDADVAPKLLVSDVRISEANSSTKSISFVLTLSELSGQTVSVKYTTADGTAAAGSDYTAKSGTVTFYPGWLSQTVNVTVSGDTGLESDESFYLNLSDPIHVELDRNQATGWILNDDPLPLLEVAEFKLVEKDSGVRSAEVIVRLSAASAQAVSVNYSTANGTATAGSDYTASSGTLTFSPGQTQKSVFISIIGDALEENDETIVVNFSNPSNAVLLTPQIVGSILNDDNLLRVSDVNVSETNAGVAQATFVVSLDAPANHEVRVAYSTLNGTAQVGSDYASSSGTLILAAGELSKAITVSILGDILNEVDETFYLDLANPVGTQLRDARGVATIQNDDSLPVVSIIDTSVSEGTSGTKSILFEISLTAASGRVVSVSYATADGSAIASQDYIPKTGTVSFAAGVTKQTVSVTVNGDSTPEADETMLLKLTGVTGAVVGNNQAVGKILDDDSLTINDVTATEGDNGLFTMVFTVGLALPRSEEVRVAYATSNRTAMAGADYVATSGVVVFAPGNTSETITVIGLADTFDEKDEDFLVNLSNPVNAIIADNQGVGMVLDDDATPTATINDVTISEGNSGAKNATLVVTLSAASGQLVQINYTTLNEFAVAGSDYTTKSGTLNFNPGTVTQSLTIAIQGDLDVENEESLLVALSSPINLELADVEGRVTILDDDAAEEGLSALSEQRDDSLAESDSWASDKTLAFKTDIPARQGNDSRSNNKAKPSPRLRSTRTGQVDLRPTYPGERTPHDEIFYRSRQLDPNRLATLDQLLAQQASDDALPWRIDLE